MQMGLHGRWEACTLYPRPDGGRAAEQGTSWFSFYDSFITRKLSSEPLFLVLKLRFLVSQVTDIEFWRSKASTSEYLEFEFLAQIMT